MGTLPRAIFNALKESVATIEKRVHAVSAGVAEVPMEGDFEALRKVMGCIFEVRNKADEIEYELDSLAEAGSYLAGLAEPNAVPVAGYNSRTAKLLEEWTVAKKSTPALRKAIKSMIEVEASRISDEVKAFENQVWARTPLPRTPLPLPSLPPLVPPLPARPKAHAAAHSRSRPSQEPA